MERDDHTKVAENLLSEAGVRITANRLLIMRTLMERVHGVFSLADLSEMMPTMDESTIFRTIVLLEEHHVVHAVNDGTGMAHYCLCHCAAHDHMHGHIHLTCTSCHRTYCLEEIEIPAVRLPEGFVAEEATYVVRGRCPHCSRQNG